MINLLLSCFASSVILCGFGIKSYYFLVNRASSNFYESIIYGPILLSLITIIINFFFPINKLVGSIIIIYSCIFFLIFFLNEKKKFKIFKFLVITTIISFLLILLSNINRPDAGLYHLPYISLLNENKILLGSANIHFRFGHISSLQYISAAYYNSLFPVEFITLPMATIASFFFYYISNKFLKSLKKQNEKNSLIFFIILIFSIYSFNRYSKYGNDAISHMYFLILVILFLEANLKKINSNEFHKIVFICVFLFTLKPFMLITFLLPFIIFIISRDYLKLFLNKKILISFLFLSIWIIKNILVSGCMIYPLKLTCFEKLEYYNSSKTKSVALESEAWAKDFPNINSELSENNFSTTEEYIKNLNWVSTWTNNHFQIIVEKILPFIVFLFLTLIILILFRPKNDEIIILSKNYLYLFISSILFTVIWFLKFPIYRYGMSFIFLTITLIFIYSVRKLTFAINLKFIKNYCMFIFFIGIIGFVSKNFIRIYNNYNILYENYPWPKIYTLKDNEQNK